MKCLTWSRFEHIKKMTSVAKISTEVAQPLLEQLANHMMRDGKKQLAVSTLNDTLNMIRSNPSFDKTKVVNILKTFGDGVTILPPSVVNSIDVSSVTPTVNVATNNPYAVSQFISENDITPAHILAAAVLKVSPLVYTATLRRSNKNVQIPVPLPDKRRFRYGIKWLIQAADKRKGSFALRIMKECEAIIQGSGGQTESSDAFQRKLQAYRDALANKSNIVMVDRKIRKF